MRKQDLRRFDINLMISILSVFCLISLMFIIFWATNFVNFMYFGIKTMLWSSYGLVFLIAILVYFVTRQPDIVWGVSKDEIPTSKCKPKYDIDIGQSYIFKTDKKSLPRKVFKELVKCGREGLVISRTKPSVIKEKLNLKDAFVLWLTEAQVKNAINPLDIEELMYTVKKYLSKNKNSVILIEGIEYLINSLPFNKVLHFVQDLRDEVVLSQANFFLKIDPELVKPVQLSLIEKEFVGMKINGF